MAQEALLLPGQQSLSTSACLPIPPQGRGVGLECWWECSFRFPSCYYWVISLLSSLELAGTPKKWKSEDLSLKQRNFPAVRGLLCDVVESPLQAVLEQKPDNHLWEIPVLGGEQPSGLIFWLWDFMSHRGITVVWYELWGRIDSDSKLSSATSLLGDCGQDSSLSLNFFV